MSNASEFILEFLIGGSVVTLISYFGSKGSGDLAAFITMFPSISTLGFYFVYRNGGNEAVMKFVQGFFLVVPSWILYIVLMYILCSRLSVIYSLVISVSSYMISSFFLSKIKRIIFT
jgi:uncharacterized membrane protein (GlpM family)